MIDSARSALLSCVALTAGGAAVPGAAQTPDASVSAAQAPAAAASEQGEGTVVASAAFADGSDAFDRGEYTEATRKFEQAIAAGMKGPAVRYNAGVSHYKSGNYDGAERAFRSLADDFPQMRDLAEYNLGLSLMQQGREDQARAAFERARRSPDEKIARLADEMLARTPTGGRAVARSGADDAGGTGAPPSQWQDGDGSGSELPPWIRLFDVGLGYDDNVALVEEASLPAGESVDSSFVEGFGLISGRFDRAPSLRFDASAYLVRYDRAAQYDQDAVQLGLAWLWDWNGWELDAGPHYNYSVLAGSAFEQRLGATLNARHAVGDSTTLLIRFTHDRVNDLKQTFDFVQGSRDRVSIGLQQEHDRGRLAIGYVHEQNDRLGASVSPKRHELYAGYEYAFSTDWSVEVQGALRTSRYHRLEAPREEDLSQLSLTATRDFDTGWQLLGQYRIADNDSNAPDFSYDRNRLVVGLNKLF